MTPLNQAAPSREPETGTQTIDATRDMVVSVIAEVTRYPRDILLPEAHLEEDLGIDSVKRAEILAVLASRFKVPETAAPPVGELRTIADVVTALDQLLAGAGGEALPPALAPAVDLGPRVASTPAEGVAGAVIAVIVQVTRYPRELLVMGADLEEDLGFDYGQRSSILGALRQQLAPGLPADDPSPAPRTIGDLVTLVERAATPEVAEAIAPAPAPAAAPAILTQVHPPAVNPRPFAGRTVLVTGSGHGLGRTIATHLAGLGATVIINSFHSRARGDECVQEIVESGGDAIHLWGSVANPKHLQAIFDAIDERYGGLDCFISNASNGILAPLKDVRTEDWDQAFRTNVIALHQGSLLASALMRKRGGGKIVAISSPASQRYVDHYGCMGPIKAAVESLVRYLAIELGEHNVQVNSVVVGPVAGERLDKYPDGETLRSRWQANVPRKRFNDADEVAEAVTFLLTSSGMNGASLLLDAGLTQRIIASH